jgi:hypothetical protein
MNSKTFRVILSNPTGGAVLGTRTNALVSITNNDVGIQFQFATNSVAEDAGVVRISVLRGTDDTNFTVTPDQRTSMPVATSRSPATMMPATGRITGNQSFICHRDRGFSAP